AEALGKVPVGLPQERAGVEIEVDAAGIAWHLRVVTPEQLPQRKVCAFRLEIMQGNVEGGLRERRGTSTPTVVQTPPHLAPKMLDAVGIFTCNQVADRMLQRCMDGGAVVSGGVGVANALAPVAVAQAHRDELEGRYGPVRGVGEHTFERNAVVSRLDGVDFCHCCLASWSWQVSGHTRLRLAYCRHATLRLAAVELALRFSFGSGSLGR